MFCPSCGASVPDNARFCGACGARLEPTAPTAAPPTPAAIAPVPPSPASASAVVPAVAPVPRPLASSSVSVSSAVPGPPPHLGAAPVPVSPLYDWLLATVPWMTLVLLVLLAAIVETSKGGSSPQEAGTVMKRIYMLSFLPLSFLFNWLGCKALRAAGRTRKDGRPVGVQSGDILGFIFLGPLCTPFCVRRLNRLGGHGPWSMLTSIFLPILTVVLLYLVTEGISSEDVRRQGIAEAHRVDFDMDEESEF